MNKCSKIKIMSDAPLPMPRMKKAKNIKHENTNFNKWEMNTYENRNTAYQELSILLPTQNS